MELIDVANLIIDKIKKDYKDDIAIVALCGSYIYNDTHPKSDLDFYFIPKTERGREMSQCFILNDIGFDFWGMSWSRAESLAKYNETNTSIISKAKVIYYASRDDLDRFNALRNIGASIPQNEFLLKAAKQLERCEGFYFKMLEAGNDFSLAKQNAVWVLYYAAFSTALINQRYIERGGRNLLAEVLAMPLYPKDFEHLYIRIIDSKNIDEMVLVAQTVILNLRTLIQSQKEPGKSINPQGWYEELKSMYNKLLYECQTNNQQGIVLAIARIDRDVSLMVSGAGHSYAQFTNLFSIWQKGSTELIQAINTHEKMLVDILERESVPIVKYADIIELQHHLDSAFEYEK